MKKQTLILMCICLLFVSFANATETLPKSDSTEISKDDKLVVMWTSGDKDVANNMVFLYVYNAKKYDWWKEITLLVWGPSAKLLAEDEELQAKLKKMQDLGVKVLACKGCADRYKVSDELQELGAEVRYVGVDLTNFIKEGHLITF